MSIDPQNTNPAPQRLQRRDGAHIAYHSTSGDGPGIIFLGGFRSDMTGTKATALEAVCQSAGRPFVRFDYFGHGKSSGDFREGTIGRWLEDSVAVLDELTRGPQILVGSSMGGWLMLRVATTRPDRVAGLIGLAAAPDFTEELMWPSFDDDIRRKLETDGVYLEHSQYDPEPTPITMQLIQEGRAHLVLDDGVEFDGPVRLLQGMEDPDVPWQHAVRLMEALRGDDITLTLIKHGDHRLSTPPDIALLARTLEEVCASLL